MQNPYIYDKVQMTNLVRLYENQADLYGIRYIAQMPKENAKLRLTSRVAEVRTVKQSRGIAKWNSWGGAASVTTKREMEIKTYYLPKIRESFVLPTEYTMANPERRDAILAEETADLDLKIMRTLELTLWDAVNDGVIDIDQTGPSYSYHEDFEMPGYNKSAIGTLWSAAGSDPVKDLNDIKDKIALDTGFELKIVITSAAVRAILMNHASVLAYLGDGQYKDYTFREGVFPPNFLGLKWYFYDRYYVNAAGGNDRYTTENKIYMFPEKRFGAVQVYEGLTEINPKRSGKASKMVKLEDPEGIHVFEEWSVLPVLPYPDIVISKQCIS